MRFCAIQTEQPAAVDHRLIKQAIDWMVRLRANAGNDDLRRQFECWRTSDDQHENAWRCAQRLENDLSAVFKALPDPDTTINTLELCARQMRRRRALKLLSAGVVAGAGGLFAGYQLAPWQRWGADYSTATGQRASFSLADGSRLQLNTDSVVNVDFDSRQRLLSLMRGEILVETGGDAASPTRRPLRVRTRHGMFEAIGTRFTLRQHDTFTTLSVQKGQVAMMPRRFFSTAPVIAASGETFSVDATGVHAAAATPLDNNAWTDGLIITRNMRLADFVAEIGRYRHGLIRCHGDVAELRLSGVFRADDTEQLLALLPKTLPVQVRYRTRWWITIEAAERAR